MPSISRSCLGFANTVRVNHARAITAVTCHMPFYIHGSVHRNPIIIRSNKMQEYAGVYLLQNYSTCFGCLSHPSAGVHQTVTAASGTGHITYPGNNLPQAWPLGHA